MKHSRSGNPTAQAAAARGMKVERCDRGAVARVRPETAGRLDLNDPFIQEQARQAALETEHRLSDPNYEWYDWEDVLTEFAAPNIAGARRHRGLTQAQLGAKLGMPQSQISRMEKDPESVTYRTLRRVARALNMRVQTLLAQEFAPAAAERRVRTTGKRRVA